MCGAHVIEHVRASLSRRAMLLGTAGIAAGAASGALAQEVSPPAPVARLPGSDAIAAATRGVTDLTHTLTPDFPTFSGQPQFSMDEVRQLEADGYNVFVLTVDEHTGTHMDAPLHFSAGGTSVDLLPVRDLVAPLVRIDIAGRAASDPDAMLTPDDIAEWVADNGPLPERCVVAMHSGWARHLGTNMFRNADASGAMHFPGFHPETAALLMAESSAVGIAVDTLSLDRGISSDFAVHVNWLGAGHFGIECVAGLETLPAGGAVIVVGAPKHAGGTGGPCRVLALG